MNVGRPGGEDLTWLIEQASQWVDDLRQQYGPVGQLLPPARRALLAPFFPAAILDRVRFAEVAVIPEPPFKQEAIARGVPEHAIDFPKMDGLALVDVVLVSSLRPGVDNDVLAFHELVHVVQYELLGGLDEFMARYVYGFRGTGWVYNMIPLEAMAYRYAGVFQENRQARFSVVEFAQQILFNPPAR